MFKQEIAEPVIGLSPMDGITDAANRFIQKKYGNPDIIFTEFKHVMGICRGSTKLIDEFHYDDSQRPIIAQIFGAEAEYFYHAAKVMVALGFDGLDLNMGCPAKKVEQTGAGAGLIRTPELAKEIVRNARKGIEDYFATGELTGLTPEVTEYVNTLAKARNINRDQQKEKFTLSVKTRIGYDSIVISDWIKHLTEVSPDWITVHGRTLKQLYTGVADWDAIALAVQSTHIPVLGNGDIKEPNDAVRLINHTGAKGVLVGRATYGNPWFFKSKSEIKSLKDDIHAYSPSESEVKEVMLEHAKLHATLRSEGAFVQMRKHLGWYGKWLNLPPEAKRKLVTLNTFDELEAVLDQKI